MRTARRLLLAVLALVLMVGYSSCSGGSTGIATVHSADKLLSSGKPVMFEFYSDS